MDQRNNHAAIGGTLRDEREARGVSQSALAIRTGVPQSAISRIESEKEIPSLERWTRLLAGLGLRPEIDLVQIAQPPSEPQHSLYARRRDPGENLELGASYIELYKELRGKAKRAAA